MTTATLTNRIRRLYMDGRNENEICQLLRSSPILTKHLIATVVHREPAAESAHYVNRHNKGRLVRANIVNNDPYEEAQDRFNGGKYGF